MTADARPVGKVRRRDRVALARLWGLLYRLVGRVTLRTDQLTQRVAALEARVGELEDRYDP